MLRFQSGLPRLPVPDLDDTCGLYLRLVRPLLSRAEYGVTEHAVVDFLKIGGEGERLQQRLLRWSGTPGVDNWLDPFWDDWYLCDETPLLVNVSTGFVLARANRPQLARAAQLLSAALSFKQLVDREELQPDHANGEPLCMREYSRLLSATRVPGKRSDRVERHPDSRHVVVVRENRFFSLEVLDEDGRAYDVADLERRLQRIVDDVETEGAPVGVLTTDRRPTWARVREVHFEHGPAATRESLLAVERAILVLVLERGPAPPQPRSVEAARMSLHGDCSARWFDKSIQLIVAANGVAAICMEHAGFDGSAVLRFAEYLVEHEDRETGTTAHPVGRPPLELVFELDDAARTAIDRARRAAVKLVRRTDLALLDLGHFGRRALVRRRVSPDGFVQTAFQLAYFTLTGETASTYEAVSTKRFLHGRTEAMRSVSAESAAFVRSLRGSRTARGRAGELLRAAGANHAETVARCRAGRGVDRHLLGLRRMVEPDEPLPALFADEGYARLSRSVLSTSALPSSPGVELTCFGPVVDEGFGLSYTIHDDRICCAVTNFHGLADAFVGELERGLVEMSALLSEA